MVGGPTIVILALCAGVSSSSARAHGKPALLSWRGGAGLRPPGQRPGAPAFEQRVTYGIPVSAEKLDVRERFVERVYRTLSVQLLGTMLLCWYTLTYHPRFLLSILRERAAMLAVIFAPMVAATAIANAPRARKTAPWSYLLLGAFTGAESLVLSVFMLFVPREIVLRAGLTTAAVVGWLSLYARTTRRNYTRAGPTITRGLLALLVLELAQLFFFRRSPLAHSLYSAASALALCALLVVNTQQIVGGSSEHATIAADEHVLASVLLYSDIISLFMHLVNAMNGGGGRQRNNSEGGDRSSSESEYLI